MPRPGNPDQTQKWMPSNRTDEASQFILDIPEVKEDNQKKVKRIKNFVPNVCELFKHIESNGEIEKMKAFLDRLGLNTSILLLTTKTHFFV